MSQDPVITTHHLRKRYQGSAEEALKGITMTIRQGEFFGILGPNAAGKSTFIGILCGIIPYSAGEVKLFDRNIRRNSDWLKSRFGLVPQEIALYPSLTVFENILFYGQMHGLYGKKLKIKADESIKMFFLEEHKNKILSKCSGGIKRRVNLIAGIIHEPSLVMLDEPTLGVDTRLRTLIFDYLKALNKTGTTILYTTHYMDEAEQLCSRVSIIDDGQIIMEGKPADLIAASPGCRDLGQLFLGITGRELRD
jgi:ABC-2 type transport system ATP-binding protein